MNSKQVGKAERLQWRLESHHSQREKYIAGSGLKKKRAEALSERNRLEWMTSFGIYASLQTSSRWEYYQNIIWKI